MSNYTKTTNFTAKDALSSGDPDKLIKGSLFDTEFDALVTAIATKANSASPTFTGTVTMPSALVISGTTLSGNATFSGTNTQSGAYTISGALTCSSTVDFTGTIKANGTALKDGAMPVANAGATAVTQWVPMGYLSGLVTSNDTDTDHDISIAAGECADSTDAYMMKLTSAMVKQIDSGWAVGTAAGGMFTGSVAADTWYHVFLIRKDSDGSIDAGYDTSITAANIPAGYTAYRRIGSVLTDSSANIINFKQLGDLFLFADGIATTYAGSASPTSPTNFAVSVPLGVECIAKIGWEVKDSSSEINWRGMLSHPDLAIAASANAMNMGNSMWTNEGGCGGEIDMATNASSQLSFDATSAGLSVWLNTLGYTDYRGRI